MIMWTVFLWAVMTGCLISLRILGRRTYTLGSNVAIEPNIPTALEDWDAEFKRLTGVMPEGSALGAPQVRVGKCAVISSRPVEPKLSVLPGDVAYVAPQPRWYQRAEDGRIIDAGNL